MYEQKPSMSLHRESKFAAVILGDFTVKTQNCEGKSVFNWKSIK